MLKNLLYSVLLLLAITSCSNTGGQKIPVYGWNWDWNHAQISDSTLLENYKKWKSHGLDGILIGARFDYKAHEHAAKLAKAAGLEYHAWAVCMLQGGKDSTWYAINRDGQSAYKVQAYTPGYTVLCPNNPNVINYLKESYSKLADIPEVDYVHLDFIRYADVILSRGLWDKYGLVMNEEYPTADYCYCDKCVADFKAATGIDIKSVEDPSKCQEWKDFRYNVITNLVKEITAVVHAKGKKVSAAVFPGPSYAKKLVRQDWSKWEIDAFFPMNYNDFYAEPAAWVPKVTAEEVEAAHGHDLYSGLFICRDWQHRDQIKDPEGKGLIPSEIPEVVKGVMATGATGIALYSLGDMTDEHWEALESAVFPNGKKK